jgi:isocitrate dehydrogenase
VLNLSLVLHFLDKNHTQLFLSYLPYNHHHRRSQFCALANVDIVPCDISLAGRVLAAFPDKLSDAQRVPDNLSYLGDLSKQPDCAIVKLPNISAPLNQLTDCIAELRSKGYDVPLYPSDDDVAQSEEAQRIRRTYQGIMGSAVNPVLREGNSDRRVAAAVKAYAQKNPHRLGLWSKASRTHVAHMEHGDFYQNEQSYCIPKDESAVAIQHIDTNTQAVTILKESVPLTRNEVIDASFISIAALTDFYATEIKDALDDDLLLSLHLKATMMKISDPIMFGHAIRVYFAAAVDKHADTLQSINANLNHGLASLFELLDTKLPPEQAAAIRADFELCFEVQPWLAMVDSDKGITNLHAPNDVIIDASMPVVIRDSGKMYNRLGEMEDVKCLIPDRCYATVYQEVISYVKSVGQFDVATMGNVVRTKLLQVVEL